MPGKAKLRGKKRRIRPPSAAMKARSAELRQLAEFPGMNLSRLYVGVVQQSRDLGDAPHVPVYPKQVKLLDAIMADVLEKTHKAGDVKATAQLGCRMMRACDAAEDNRVKRYVAETTLGAAAMQVEGVNKLLQLRQEIKAEKKTGMTIDNMPAHQAPCGSSI